MISFKDYKHLSESHFVIGSGFFTLNLDTVIVTTLVALLIACVSYYCITTDLQDNKHVAMKSNAIEYCYDFIYQQVKFVPEYLINYAMAVLGVVYYWIACLNLFVILPDSLSIWIQTVMLKKEYTGFQLLCTDDFNLTLALSVSSVFMCIIIRMYQIGFLEFVKHCMFRPFNKLLVPFNLFFNSIELMSRLLGLALRLYLNIYTGKVVSVSCGSFPPFMGGIVYGFWNLIHVAVALIQVMIFAQIILSYIKELKPHNYVCAV